LSAYTAYKSQEDTNKASAHEADINRQWMTEMSNSAHQREVKDLVAAGLNPVLSTGVGASTPGGSMPSLSAPGVAASRSFSDATTALSSARVSREQVKTLQSQQAVNSAQVAKLQADAAKSLSENQALKGTLKYSIGGMVDSVQKNINAASAKAASMFEDLSGRRRFA